MQFNSRYKVYLDWTVPKNTVWDWDDTDDANWTEIFPDVKEPKKAPFNKEMFTRYSWGQVTFKNNPNLTGDAAETYNLIANAANDQDIRIKIILETDLVNPDTSITIRGYFGTNDGEYDEDEGLIVVTPTVLDQYTDLVENWETEVPIFGATTTKQAKWSIDLDIQGILYTESHTLPVELRSSDFNEAKSPTGNSSVDSSIFYNAGSEYDGALKLYVNADVTKPYPSVFYFLLSIRNGDGTLSSDVILGNLENGTISTTYEQDITIPKGGYFYIAAVITSVSDSIYYTDIRVELNTVNIAYPTTDVSVNIQDSDLVTKTIWTELKMGTTESIKKSLYDANIPTLATYFETDGSPKDTLLTMGLYAPYGVVDKIGADVIKELDTGTIPIHGLYLGSDLETVLSPYGFELSEVEVFSNFWWSGWFNSIHKARTHAVCKFSRFERLVTIGETLSGWTDTGYDENGKRLWVKAPFDGTITDWELGNIDGTGGTNASIEWDARLKSVKTYPSSSDSLTLPTRDFKEIVKTVFNGTFISLANNEVNSAFLWNDTDSNITVDAGVNYYTGDTNWFNNIAVAHTYQLQTTNNNSNDSELKISIKNLLTEFKAMFHSQIFWWVDTDGVLHIEHLQYIDISKQILDLTVSATDSTPYDNNIELLDEISKWKNDKSEMYSLIEFKIANSENKDFTDNYITYDKIVSNKRNEDIKDTISTQVMTTDIRYCVQNPSDISNGMILLNHDASYNTVIASVPISNTNFENGNLALSNLLNKYKYEGIFLNGKINDVSVEFDVTTRTKVGKPITIKGIYDYDYFKSKIGIGRIETMTHDLNMEHTIITLRYRFGSGSISDRFVLMVSEPEDYVGADNVQFDFG